MSLNRGFRSIFFNISFFLRASSAGLKFIFVIFLANFESTSLVGEYALLATISAIFIQIIGFDVTTIVGRELHKKDQLGKFSLIVRQYLVYAGSYILSSILIFISFYFIVKSSLVLSLCFIFIVLLEHFFTEVFRTFVSLVKVKSATIIQFLKTAPYIVYLMIYSFISDVSLSLEFIIYVWLINLLIVFSFFVFYLLKELRRRSFKCVKVSFQECKTLVFDAAPYFMVIIFGVLFSNVDKIVISKYLGSEVLGIYFTYFTICSVLSLLISFTVGVNQGPVAIKVFSEKGVLDYISVRKKLIADYIKVLAFGGFFILVFGLIYLRLVESAQGFVNYITFFLLLLSVVFLSFSQVYKLDLYLLKKDKEIVFSFLSSLILNLVLLSSLTPNFGVLGAALASATSSLYMLICFYFLSKRVL
ncbi:MAG: polysaccharide biosynthesis C-terminal domain-containing protein [Colwelliaceae bacterium]|nr:polysaccharide biosynthesis C-terminal domain-containing protein [Colwelliaceae bacterium]